MTNIEFLLEINNKAGKNIEALYTSGKLDGLNKCIAFSEDLDLWLSYCGAIHDSVLIKEAQTECINSIYMCAQCFYKEAFSSLRQVLEHTLFSILLSTNDYKYRLWQAGKADMSWSQLMDEQNGIFGVQFIQAYADDLDDNRSIELRTVSKNVYRECSEFVHGNYTKLKSVSSVLSFNENVFDQYIECFDSIKYVICMALFIRFREVLSVPESIRILESVVIDNIGMLPEVQLLFSEGAHKDE